MEILAGAVGLMISLMLVANATLQQFLGPGAALVAVHLLGLILSIPLALLVRAPVPASGGNPWPLYTAGLVGIALLLINNRTVPVLGVGLAAALSVVGQLAGSALVDQFGFFGLTRRPLTPTRAVGLLVACLGVLLMTLGGR